MKRFSNYSDWEKSVVLELQLEHEYVCRIHKVRLRPVTITLFDSETRWGQFDPVTRAISISVKLVRKFPWHDVVGVFRHEMAHQLVCEESAEKSEASPHGEVFKNACRRLGVPDLYSRAGVDLTSSGFDWREEVRDPKSEAILDKVRKLLALADSSNEHEALLAMEKVRELYAKYNIELNQSMQNEGFVHLVLNYGKKKLPSWFVRIAVILSEHFFVRTLICQQFEQMSGAYHGAIEVIGRKENVLMAEYVFYFLIQQLEALVENKIQAERGLSRRDRNSYRLGILEGFSRKLKWTQPLDQTESGRNDEFSDIMGGNKNIEISKMDKEIDSYMGTIYPKLRKRGGGSVRINNDLYASGESAGMSLRFHKPVSEKEAGPRALLSYRHNAD